MSGMDELNNIIQAEGNYYLDTKHLFTDIKIIQAILDGNGYLLTKQIDGIMVYEKPNDHDTFNVKNRHRQYMAITKPMLDYNMKD